MIESSVMHDSRRRILWTSFVLILLLPSCVGAAEPGDLATAARRFRLQTYQTYRSNRVEFDRRNAAARRVLDEWKRGGEAADEMAAALSWFARAQQTGLGMPLPEYPVRDDQPTASAQSVDLSTPPPTMGGESDQSASPFRDQTPNPIETAPTTEPDIVLDADFVAPPIGQVDLPRIRSLSRSQTASVRDKPFGSVTMRETVPLVTTNRPTFAAPPLSANALFETRPTVDATPPFDLNVLSAKIRSVNLSLQKTEQDLSEDRAWALGEIEAVAKSLARQLREYDFVMTYYDVTPEPYRSRLSEPREPTLSVALFAQRMFELKIRLASNVTLNSDELARLNRVFDQIQQLSPRQRGR